MLDTALSNHWTTEQEDTVLFDHWTTRHSNARQLDCLEQHCLTIGQLDKAQSDHLNTLLASHWTV